MNKVAFGSDDENECTRAVVDIFAALPTFKCSTSELAGVCKERRAGRRRR